jgi:hypothetical protein
MINTRSGHVEAELLELLADAHSRIRGLEAHVEQLTEALLTISLNDRRRATGSHADRGRDRERRRLPRKQTQVEQTVADV